MKKLIFSAALAACGLFVGNAQDSGFEAGAYVGIPVADVSDGTSFNIGVTAAYYFNVAEGFKLGGLLGYDHFIGKDEDINTGFGTVTVEGEDAGFIPSAASAKYNFTENFFVGADRKCVV